MVSRLNAHFVYDITAAGQIDGFLLDGLLLLFGTNWSLEGDLSILCDDLHIVTIVESALSSISDFRIF